jgi:hypothetical protein
MHLRVDARSDRVGFINSIPLQIRRMRWRDQVFETHANLRPPLTEAQAVV